MVGNFDRFSVINRVSGFPSSSGGVGSFNSFGNNGFGGVGSFSSFGNNGFGGVGSFNSFGNNSFGGGGFNSFSNPYSSFGGGGFGGGFGGIGGGAGAWGALAASIGFLVGAIVQNIITRRQGNEGGEAQDCGCSDKNSGHPNMQDQAHSNYIDGSAEHRWEPEGSTNMSFDVDY